MELILFSYVFQLSLGAYALFGLPRRGELPTFYEGARKQMLLWAVLPCGPLSVIVQLVLLGIYMTGLKHEEAKVAKAEQAFMPTTRPQSSGNPFQSGSSGSRPSPPTQNPFGGDAGNARASGTDSANPFASPGRSDLSDSSADSDDPNGGEHNPFAT